MLPPAPEEGKEEQDPMPIDDRLYIQRMINQGVSFALKACDRAAEIGVDDIAIARMAAERRLRYAQDRHKARGASEGVQIYTPSDESPDTGRGTDLYPSQSESQRDTPQEPVLLAASLDYTTRGIPVFPVRQNKAPYTPRGFKDATCDEATIREWWRKWPDAGIGIPTGFASGWLVLDSDPRHGGDASLCQLLEEHGELPETLEAETGGGGHHIVIEYPLTGRARKLTRSAAGRSGRAR